MEKEGEERLSGMAEEQRSWRSALPPTQSIPEAHTDPTLTPRHSALPGGHVAASTSLALCQASSVAFRLGNSAAPRC